MKIFNFNAQTSPDADAQIVLKNSHDVFISQCRPSETSTFLRLAENSDQISVTGNDLSRVEWPFRFDESMQMSALAVANNLPDKSAHEALFSDVGPIVNRDEFGLITMNSFVSRSDVRYTLDGSEPTLSSLKYVQPFEKVAACEVKAKVFKGSLSSRTESVKFEKLPALEPVIETVNAFFYNSIDVEIACPTPGAEIRYTLDGSEPTETSPLYTTPVKIKKNTTLRAQSYKQGLIPGNEAMSKYESVELKSGVQYRYYKGKWGKLPDFINMRPEKSGVVEQFCLDEIDTGESDFALLLIGYLDIEHAGEYTFYCGSNDGSSMTIDNTLLIKNDGTHGFREPSGELYLTKGIHRIEMRYFQAGGSCRLRASWKGPGFDKREIVF